MTKTKRKPLLSFDWFKKSGRMAIADRVYVEGLGVCTHQPMREYPKNGHRVMDKKGKLYIVETEQLYLPDESDF